MFVLAFLQRGSVQLCSAHIGLFLRDLCRAWAGGGSRKILSSQSLCWLVPKHLRRHGKEKMERTPRFLQVMSAQQPPAELPEQEHTFSVSLCHYDTNKWSSWMGKALSLIPSLGNRSWECCCSVGWMAWARYPYLHCNHWIFCSLNFQSISKTKCLKPSACILFSGNLFVFFFQNADVSPFCICMNKLGRWAFSSFVHASTTILQMKKKKWHHNWGRP